MKKSNSDHKLIFRVLALCVGTLAALFLVEFGVRVVRFQPRGRALVPNEYRLSDVPGVLYEPIPGKDYLWQYGARSLFDRGFSIPVSINNLGFRDTDMQLEKPADTFRILVLGDSVTMGMGVLNEQSYCEQLEQELNRETAGSFRIEVVNTGVGGYNTRQELAFLRNRGLGLEPDMVVLGFHVNDITEQTTLRLNKAGFLVREDGQPAAANPLDLAVFVEKRDRSPWQWLREESHLLRWLSGRQVPTQQVRLREATGGRNRRKAADALREFQTLLQDHRIPWLLAIVPKLQDLPEEHDFRRTIRWLRTVCESRGIHYLSLEDAIAGIPMEELWVHPRDHHPNARAHRLFAEAILACLEVADRAVRITCRSEVPEQPALDSQPQPLSMEKKPPRRL